MTRSRSNFFDDVERDRALAGRLGRRLPHRHAANGCRRRQGVRAAKARRASPTEAIELRVDETAAGARRCERQTTASTKPTPGIVHTAAGTTEEFGHECLRTLSRPVC